MKKIQSGEKYIFVFVVMTLFLTYFSGQAFAYEQKLVRVGYVIANRYQEGRAGEYKTGYGYEYLQRIANYANWKYEYVYGSFSQLLDLLKVGEIDVMGDLSYTDERAKHFFYSSMPTNIEEYYLFTLGAKKKGARFTYADLNGARIAVLQGTYQARILPAWLEKNNIDAEIVFYRKKESFMGSLHEGGAEYILTPAVEAGNDSEEPVACIGKSSVFFGVSKKRPDLFADIEEAMRYYNQVTPHFSEVLFARYYNKAGNLKNVLSSEEKTWLKEHGNIKIGCLKDNPPYAKKKKNGEVDGLAPSYFKNFWKSINYDGKAEFLFYESFDDLTKAVGNGEVDAIFPMHMDFYFAEQMNVAISEPIANVAMAFSYIDEDSLGEVKKVAVLENTPAETYISVKYPQAKMFVAKSIYDCAGFLLEGKVDCIFSDSFVATQLHQEYPEIKNIYASLGADTCFAIKKGNTVLLKLLNRGASLYSNEKANIAIINSSLSNGMYTTSDFISEHRILVSIIIVCLIVALVLSMMFYLKMLREKKELLKVQATLRRSLQEKSREASKMTEAKRVAEDEVRSNSNFIFNMSHDLRTLMNAVLGFTRMAKKNVRDVYRVSDYLLKIEKSSEHLIQLINDILDLVRIESGRASVEMVRTNLEELTNNLLAKLSVMAKEKNVVCETEIKGIKESIVYADSVHIEQVLYNIISNAIKYTNEGGIVKCTLEQATSKNFDGTIIYRYTVTDTGIGMREEFIENVFDVFSRDHATTAKGVLGTGLGMAIAKELMDLMGGKIKIESKIGKGTTVVLELALRTYEEAMILNQEEEAETNWILAGMRVLIVDDNELSMEAVRNSLAKADIIVEEASDGAAAVEMVAKNPANTYDLIFMDFNMPGMDGSQALSEIRDLGDKERAAVPIIALFANATEKARIIDEKMKFNGWLEKPIDEEELFGMCRKFCNKEA